MSWATPSAAWTAFSGAIARRSGLSRGLNVNPRRLEQIGYAAQIMVGISAIVGGVMVPSAGLTILLVSVGLLACFPLHKVVPGRTMQNIAKKSREAKRWQAWAMYLGLLVMGAILLIAAWMNPDVWWLRMMWVALAIWLCVPPPWLAGHFGRHAEAEGVGTK